MKEVELSADDLICRCMETEISGATAVKPEEGQSPHPPGQGRGVEAITFGLSLKKRWFNVTVAGPTGSGKTTVSRALAHRRASTEPPGMDICIHQNFTDPTHPHVLYLAPGGGLALNRLIDEFLKLLDKQIPHLLEQPAVKAQLQQTSNLFDEQKQALSREVEEFAHERGIVMQTTPQGANMIPLSEGKPMKEEDYLSLGVEEREEIDGRRREVLEKMAEINPRILALEKEKRDAAEDFLEKSVRDLVAAYQQDMRKLIQNPSPEMVRFLDDLLVEIVEKRFLFFSESPGMQPFGGPQLQVMRQQFAKNCRLNVLVDRSGAQGAPVVVESNPTYSNLIGGVDYVEDHGVLRSDFTQIRAGSLIRASGGYLILQLADLLQNPLSYYSLKRALRTGEIKLRDQVVEMGFRSGGHLEPEPISLGVKVIVVGDEQLIQLVQTHDEEFARLFKIHADFSRNLERTPENLGQYVTYLQHQVEAHGLLPLENDGLTRLIEESARTVSHQNRLTAQVNDLMDVLIEADALARAQGKFQLTRRLVDQALDKKKTRHGKIEEMVKREIAEGTILLDFEGSRVGQVNGLAVYQVGRVAFGVPTRITAQAYAGRSGLINIEREADLSGRIHTKGVLILNGYLGRLFAQSTPMALSVSICFEQNYGGIDGDSATAAEFFVILSTIAQMPLRQNIAVTGSMNQHGEIQPIGGVNEKISGFYQFAKQHGFPEGCGVMIPQMNRVNLMLDDEIIESVAEGKFHIYAISRIEQGLEVMTGIPAGEMGDDATFPPGTVYAKAAERLKAFYQHNRGTSPEEKGRPSPGEVEETKKTLGT